MITNAENAYDVLKVGTKLYRLSKGGRIIIREFTIVGSHLSVIPSGKEGYVDRDVRYEIDGDSISYVIDFDEREIGKNYFTTKAEVIENFAAQNGLRVKVLEDA